MRIQIIGLEPGQTITLTASMHDDLDLRWESWALFIADTNGLVDVSTQATITGTYAAVDPMGLFWSMLPGVTGPEYPYCANFNTHFKLVTLTAEIEGEKVAPTSIKRIRQRQDIQKIQVERINGPILLISGKDDQVWPSTELSEIAIVRLQQYKHPFLYEHLAYEDAGHIIGAPYWPTTGNISIHPVTGFKYTAGGTPKGNAFASADAWAYLLGFLESNFLNRTD